MAFSHTELIMTTSISTSSENQKCNTSMMGVGKTTYRQDFNPRPLDFKAWNHTSSIEIVIHQEMKHTNELGHTTYIN